MNRITPIKSSVKVSQKKISDVVPRVESPYLLIGVILLIHASLGLLGLTQNLAPQVVVVAVIINIVIFWISYRHLNDFARWFDNISIENLALIHTLRAPIGVAFLVFAERNMLPDAFAEIAGWGDVITGFWVLPLILVSVLSPSYKFRYWNLFLWNSVGTLDLCTAISTGVYLTFQDQSSMALMTQLPFFLIPGFLVPWLICTHVIIFKKLWKEKS